MKNRKRAIIGKVAKFYFKSKSYTNEKGDEAPVRFALSMTQINGKQVFTCDMNIYAFDFTLI